MFQDERTTYRNRGRSIRKVAKVVAEESAATAAQVAIHKEANQRSSSVKNGLVHGSKQLGTPPTLRLDERL